MNKLLIMSLSFFFFAKLGIHIFLEFKAKKYSNFKTLISSGMAPFGYFFFYLDEVESRWAYLKFLCNLFYSLFLILLPVYLIIISQ